MAFQSLKSAGYVLLAKVTEAELQTRTLLGLYSNR